MHFSPIPGKTQMHPLPLLQTQQRSRPAAGVRADDGAPCKAAAPSLRALGGVPGTASRTWRRRPDELLCGTRRRETLRGPRLVPERPGWELRCLNPHPGDCGQALCPPCLLVSMWPTLAE